MHEQLLLRGRRVAGFGVGLPNLGAPPIPTTFPPTSDPVQLAAQQQLLGAEQAAQAQMPAALASLQSNPNIILQQGDLAKAKAVYDQYAAKSVQAVYDIAQAVITGQPGSFTMMAPLVGAMLTAAAVAPVVGAAVAAGLAILDGIAEAINSALNGQFCTDPKTQWQLPGGACITNPAGRPTGPSDPAWTTWQAYEASYKQNGVYLPGFVAGTFAIDAAFPFYAETIGCEVDKLNAMASGPVRDFFLTYYRAWQHAAEQALNGFVMPSPWVIFAQTLLHWNAQRPGPAVTLVPTPFWGSGSCWTSGAPNDPMGQSYIGGLLNGDIPGAGTPAIPPYKQNLQLNTGGGSSLLNIINVQGGNPPAAAPTSTASKVAIGAALVGGAAAGGIGLYSLYHGVSYANSARKLWKKVAGH